MNIGFDAKRAFMNTTGLGNYSRFVINALLKYKPQHEYFAYTPKVNQQLSIIKEQFDKQRLQTRLPTVNFKLLTNFWRSGLIINDLRRDKINIFHGLSNELPFGINKSGIKSIVTIHDLIFLRYPELYPAIDRFFYKVKFQKACEQADAIIAVSEQTKRDIEYFYQINSNKIHVIYQDCNEVFQQRLDNQEIESVRLKYNFAKPYILSVGTITERKNQLTLVKAFEALKNPNLDLILVGGKTKYQTQIEEYIAKVGLKNVQILNKVPFADLPAIYQGAEVFVYPSIFEGFGIPIIEALHSGVPVVAATGSCLEEAGGSGALYANPLIVNEFCEKIQIILQDSALKEKLIRQGENHVRQFSGEKIANDLAYLYQNL